MARTVKIDCGDRRVARPDFDRHGAGVLVHQLQGVTAILAIRNDLHIDGRGHLLFGDKNESEGVHEALRLNATRPAGFRAYTISQ